MQRVLQHWTAGVILLVLCASASGAESLRGAKIYREQCARCHGRTGQGTVDNYPDALTGDRSIAQLAAVIAETMPEDKEEKCSAEDARDVAAYIYESFYSPEAQFRNKPARIELSRLTVRQYQNAVTDLIGSFRPAGGDRPEHGLRAEYFSSRYLKPEEKQHEQVDAEVNFDFGEASPLPEKLKADKFAIRWQGTILAPDTGDYEFVLRTHHAAQLWINDQTEPLIDALVKSGDDSEYRAEIRLLGGRAYPLKLEFSKAQQGVGDSQRKKDDRPAPVKASISLLWKRPFHTLGVVPSRSLSVNDGSEVFVLRAPFPPDDRSVGYERGTSISKAWDEATTEAAIEVAAYVSAHIDELAQVTADGTNRDAQLREFCRLFAERAFRHPLTEEQAKLYVDQQFEETSDADSAMKRVVLLVLKSPRFLYQEIGNPSPDDPYTLASRLAFGLWDSIPDTALRTAAVTGQLTGPDRIAEQLQRMVSDRRGQAKLREFLMNWLKVSQPRDIAKDPKKFPEFTADVVSDLRTSLELSLDDTLKSDSADFRELLLSDAIFLNDRLAPLYGVDLPSGAPFQKIQFKVDQRSGLLSHPYLLACFAYSTTSSPIHRGVFISRSLLGRTLQPPPESVTPLAPELHADMTTRERVALQTKPEACQTCHSMINPLGFSLEEFDAIGRWRELEDQKPVDAAGSYLTPAGEVVKFDGVRELANFLAASEETRRAFVQQLFHHLIKQPVRAYGPDRLAELQQSFVTNDFNIRKLAAEIVATSAMAPK